MEVKERKHTAHEAEQLEETKPAQANVSWRKEYLDTNIFRSIIKVNSHQLDAEGLAILKKPRYPTLIPNLCLLNANHIADKVAELPTMNKFISSELRNYSIKNPISPLRFYLTIDGYSADKHISDSLRSVFTRERIKKLKTKETQGLMWRLMDYITESCDELNSHKGFLRSLMGLSRTHTRSIYKDTNYKQGSLLNYLEALETDAERQRVKNMKQKTVTELLTKCSWCPENCMYKNHHGNRLHALLYCGHNNLKHFRTNMRKTINEEICLLVHMIGKYLSKKKALQFINKISSIYLDLQESQVGRLRKIPRTQNHAYASVNELKEKYNENDTVACILSNTNLVAIELFGLMPQSTTGILSDANIGAVDCMWLGLVPRVINDEVESQKNLIQIHTKHLKETENIANEFDEKWKLIKGLTMGLAAGIHKIVGTTSKEVADGLQKKHDLDTYTISALKKKVKRARTEVKTPSQDTQQSICVECNNELSNPVIQPQNMTRCSGITCRINKPNWPIFANFEYNKIPNEKKHCLRCTRHSSAIRAAATIMQKFLASSSQVERNQIIRTLEGASPINPSYFKFMKLLQQHLPMDKQRTKTKYTNKSRISDTHKTICRVIIQTYKSSASISSQHRQTLSILPQLLTTVLQDSELFIDNHRKRAREAEGKAKEMLEKIDTGTTVVGNESLEEIREPAARIAPASTCARRNDREHYMKETLLTNGFISNMAVRWAIEVFRNENKGNFYFANPEASSILEGWTSTQGWSRAARMFGCHRVICDKPNGLYFFPIFEGKHSAGHWLTAIISKQGRNRKGYVMDSLGKANLNASIFGKIKEMFKSTHSYFSWTNVPCFPQVEMECGPRTIMHMAYIIREINNGNTLEACMEKASLMDQDLLGYSASSIREAAAAIIGRFKSNMWTNPVRVGRIQESSAPGETSSQVKRKKRRRRNKSVNTTKCIVLSE